MAVIVDPYGDGFFKIYAASGWIVCTACVFFQKEFMCFCCRQVTSGSDFSLQFINQIKIKADSYFFQRMPCYSKYMEKTCRRKDVGIMNNVMKKLMSLTLGVAILFGSLGVAATTEASPRHHGAHMEAGNPPPPPPEHREDREHHEHHEQEKEGHSTGEVTTAAIVGAVVGAVIANNT